MFMFGLFEGKYVEQTCCVSITFWDVPWRDFFHGWDNDKRIMAIYEEGTTCSFRSMYIYIYTYVAYSVQSKINLWFDLGSIRHSSRKTVVVQ